MEAARVLHQKARVIGIQGDAATCFRISEEALKVFEEEYALSDAAWILFTIGANSASVQQYEEGIAAALRSIALHDELGDILSKMEAYLFAGHTFANWGLDEEEMRMYEKVIELNEQFRLCDYIRLIPAYAYSSIDLITRTDIPGSISKALTRARKALEYAEKTDSSLYLGIVYEFLTIEYAFAGDAVRMEEYYGKLTSLPENILSNVFSQGYLKPAMGAYYAAKNEFEKSNQHFSEIFQNSTLVDMSPEFFMISQRGVYAWALSRQGRMDEARSQREQIEKIVESVRERSSHVNVHASLMTLTRPEVNQVFEVRLDLVNVSRSQGSIVKVENLLVPGLTITEVSPDCFVHDETVEFKERAINSFEVKTVKLTVKAPKLGVLQLNPTVTYVDDLGETRTSSTRTYIINVQPAPPKYEMLAGRISTGLEELDALLFGGIPEKYAVALTSPSTDERAHLIKRFLEAGATTGEITFYITAEAANANTMPEEFPSNFYLVLCNPQADPMVPTLPNIFKLKGVENLTEIDIAFMKAFRTLDPAATGPKRICIDIVSDTLLQHHAVNSRRWLSSLLPTLKSKGFTILAVVNPRMHPQEDLEAVLGLFDGEISIHEKETSKGTARFLKIKKMSGKKYLKEEISLTEE